MRCLWVSPTLLIPRALSLHRGHADLLCISWVSTDDPRKDNPKPPSNDAMGGFEDVSPHHVDALGCLERPSLKLRAT